MTIYLSMKSNQPDLGGARTHLDQNTRRINQNTKPCSPSRSTLPKSLLRLFTKSNRGQRDSSGDLWLLRQTGSLLRSQTCTASANRSFFRPKRKFWHLIFDFCTDESALRDACSVHNKVGSRPRTWCKVHGSIARIVEKHGRNRGGGWQVYTCVWFRAASVLEN